MNLIKRLLGEGCQVAVWDEDVVLGRLAGSNREYIEQVIPHIGSLLSSDLEAVVRPAEVVIIATKSASKDRLAGMLRQDQVIIDLVNLNKSQRIAAHPGYEGICW